MGSEFLPGGEFLPLTDNPEKEDTEMFSSGWVETSGLEPLVIVWKVSSQNHGC